MKPNLRNYTPVDEIQILNFLKAKTKKSVSINSETGIFKTRFLIERAVRYTERESEI
jgi:hypothetical protein